MAKIVRKPGGAIYESVFVGQKSIFRYYCIQNVEDGIQIWVYKINKESVVHFSQLISVKWRNFKKISGSILGNVRKIEAQEK